jgi:hypothetical protein
LEGAQQDLTDMEWMRQRMKEGVVDVDSPEKAFEQSDSEEESQGVSEEKDPTEEPFGAISQVRGIYTLNRQVGGGRCKPITHS